jgi:hypothetical protein
LGAIRAERFIASGDTRMNHPVGVCKSCGDPYDLEEWDDGYCNVCMGEASVISLFELPIVSEHDQQPQD